MRRRRTALVAATLALLAATAAGCAAPTVEGAGARADDAAIDSGDDGGDDGGGAIAAPDPDGGRGAVGAPVRIPREVRDQGRPLEEVWAELEEGLREACGGEVCVELVLEESHDSFRTCEFVETRPRQQTDVERGSTVVVVAGTAPCEDEGETTGPTDERTDERTDEPTEERTDEPTEEADDGAGGEPAEDGTEEAAGGGVDSP